MSRVYSQRHPERTVFYRVLFHHIESFLKAYGSRFEREYGYLLLIVEEVVDKYLDCGNPKCGFARIKCSDCGREKLLMFSCKTRGFCPSCHAKRREEWGEWMREELILRTPHRQVVFTIPKMLRIFFKYSGGLMKVISFIEDYKVIDKIIDHLKLTFKAERPPPPAQAQFSVAAEEKSEYI